MHDDDDDWLDALGGRPPAPGADLTASVATIEAGLLRDAYRRAAANEAADAASPPLPPVDALLDRARAVGVLAPRRRWCAGCAERWQRWLQALLAPRGAAWALATVAAVVLVWPGPSPQAPDGDPVLRAPTGGVVLRQVAEPLAARDALAARLQALGVAPRRYERLGRWGLEADLPLPVSPQLADSLRQDGLAAAADGSLRVEFAAKAP